MQGALKTLKPEHSPSEQLQGASEPLPPAQPAATEMPSCDHHCFVSWLFPLFWKPARNV